jgi:hypothetical protein
LVPVDIPCDVRQIDRLVWTLLDEARDPSVIAPDAVVILANEEDPVLARVVDLVPRPGGTIVHLEVLPGGPARLRRSADSGPRASC